MSMAQSMNILSINVVIVVSTDCNRINFIRDYRTIKHIGKIHIKLIVHDELLFIETLCPNVKSF